MGNYFCDYRNAYKLGIDQVGQKAFSISVLQKNNISVPNGIVFPTEKASSLFGCSETERKIIVEKIVNYLPESRFAVRSSAVGEDSGILSWAGCFETYLDVVKDDLIDKILQCVQSSGNERVKSYAKLHNTELLTKVAVIVQEYIPADYSGICFTANPVTNNGQQMIIEYQEGTSGSVVGGNGKPCTIIIEKGFGNEIKIRPFMKELIVISEKIESLWNCPMDIEWVTVSGEIIITQARPLTTL